MVVFVFYLPAPVGSSLTKTTTYCTFLYEAGRYSLQTPPHRRFLSYLDIIWVETLFLNDLFIYFSAHWKWCNGSSWFIHVGWVVVVFFARNKKRRRRKWSNNIPLPCSWNCCSLNWNTQQHPVLSLTHSLVQFLRYLNNGWTHTSIQLSTILSRPHVVL